MAKDNLITEDDIDEMLAFAQTNAIFDMLQLQELQEHLNDAIKRGAVLPFDEHVRHMRAKKHIDAYPIVYTPSKYEGYGIIIAPDFIIDDIHADFVTTYGGPDDEMPDECMLQSIDAYLSWASLGPDERDNVQWELDGLAIVPKGKDPAGYQAYDWHASTTWPDGVKQPPCPKPADSMWA